MEVSAFFIGIVQETIGGILTNLIPIPQIKKMKYKNHLVDLIVKTLDAISATKFHILVNNGNYVQSPALVNLYKEILSELEFLREEGIVTDIPGYLKGKIRFWENPDGHLENQYLLDSVPTLESLKFECVKALKEL